jgi:hypothetical protein
MPKLLTHVAAALAVAALFGCASTNRTPRPITASGNPEVVVKNAVAAEVKTSVAGQFLNEGFSPISSNDLSAEFDRQSHNIALDVLASCRYCASPRARVTVSTLQIGKDVRVVATPYWLINPGAPSERRMEAGNDAVAAEIQLILEKATRKADAPAAIKSSARTPDLAGR